jgi:galactose oxidase
MKSSYNVNAVSLQQRPSDNANGRIGGHKIEVSSDNTSWQIAAVGTYNNDASTKKTLFVPRPARYIRITATSEAQNSVNQWTAIAEINIFEDTTYAPPAAGKGLWEKTVNFPLIPAAAALLPNGKVLIWSAFAKDNFGGQRGFTQTGSIEHTTRHVLPRHFNGLQRSGHCHGWQRRGEDQCL